MDLNLMKTENIDEMFGNLKLTSERQTHSHASSNIKTSGGSTASTTSHKNIDGDFTPTTNFAETGGGDNGQKERKRESWKGSKNTKKEQRLSGGGGNDNTDTSGNKKVNVGSGGLKFSSSLSATSSKPSSALASKGSESQFTSRKEMIESIMALQAKKFAESTSKTKGKHVPLDAGATSVPKPVVVSSNNPVGLNPTRKTLAKTKTPPDILSKELGPKNISRAKANGPACNKKTDDIKTIADIPDVCKFIPPTSVVKTVSVPVNLSHTSTHSAANTASVPVNIKFTATHSAVNNALSRKESTVLTGKKSIPVTTESCPRTNSTASASSSLVLTNPRTVSSNLDSNPYAGLPTVTTATATATSVSATPTAAQSQSESNNSSTTARQSMLKLLQEYKEKRVAAQTQKTLEREQEAAQFNAPRSVFNEDKVPRAILEQKRLLPIYSRKDEIIQLVKKNQFIIMIGETGSGKSTQLPQYLVEAGLHGSGKIGVTQPRRVAAKSLADRVAKECGVKVGTAVGYAVRFDNKTSGATIIKYMTDGLLVKECATEASLDSYSIIIIDEAHERSIHTDVCFGLLKRAARKRPDLKIIISSATLEEVKFSKYFNDAPVFNVSGKGYDVEVIYNPKTEYDYIQGAVDTIVNINRREPRGSRGDILVFLSGQDEIEQMWDMVEAKMREMSSSLCNDLVITPCYGALPFEEQQKIFDETPPNCRKVVLATNIAETSVTIEGIVHVIDCGFFKQNEYNPRSGISSLVKRRITKFQATQRKGRAGRTAAGKCYRLYSNYDFRTMNEAPSPEMTRCNVESVILDLISMGISDPLEFEFMDQPPHEAMMEAMEHLQELSALDGKLQITELGNRMSQFPLDPPLAKVVIESVKLGCSTEVLKIVALLSTQYQNIFSRGKKVRALSDKCKAKFDNPDGDILTLLRVYDAWSMNGQSESWCQNMYIQYRHLIEAEEIRIQLKDILNSRGILQSYGRAMTCPTHALHEHIRKAFTAGYFRQLAKKKLIGHAYQVLGDVLNIEDAYLHPSSSLFRSSHPWVIYHEVIKTTKVYMRGVMAIDPAWITEYAPEFARKVQAFGIPSSTFSSF